MPFAIMQESLDPPPTAEQLQEAFAAVAGLTRLDGALQAHDAYGRLASGLPLDRAKALQKALQAQRVSTVVADEEALPALPPPKALTRADALPEAFILYDALGRPRRADWDQVILIAAGSVSLTHFQRTYKDVVVGHTGRFPVVVRDLEVKESRQASLMAEVFLNGHPNRYRILAKGFNYAYLGPEASLRSTDNFLRLLGDLLRFAPGATRNCGAEFLASNPPQTLPYPSRHAFEEESVWWLWKRALPPGP